MPTCTPKQFAYGNLPVHPGPWSVCRRNGHVVQVGDIPLLLVLSPAGAKHSALPQLLHGLLTLFTHTCTHKFKKPQTQPYSIMGLKTGRAHACVHVQDRCACAPLPFGVPACMLHPPACMLHHRGICMLGAKAHLCNWGVSRRPGGYATRHPV